jgi:hypothetical protein
LFTAENMAQLTRLPLYKNGGEDLPENSLATVGYSLGSYLYKGSNTDLKNYTALSFNVLFVILLGTVDEHRLDALAESMPGN